MPHILTVVGARPNMMKAAPFLAALKHWPEAQSSLVHTGQHYDAAMSDIFFEELGLPAPDYHLGIGSGTHTEQVARTMLAFEPIVRALAPDLVVVVGDVNATLACALVAARAEVPVAHIEAGLRSFDRGMPEEINRLLTDQLADFCFTPSADADENLLREGIPPQRMFCVGNIMIDTLLHYRPHAVQRGVPQRLGLPAQRYALLTLHRPGNVDQRESLAGLMQAVRRIQQDICVCFPVHPRTRARLHEFGLWEQLLQLPNLMLLEPLGYLDMLALQLDACLVLTDSGGVQEETTVLGIPCLTLRRSTERPVTATQGTNRVIGNDPEVIVAAVRRILSGDRPQGSVPALWDGHTAERIVTILARAELLQR